MNFIQRQNIYFETSKFFIFFILLILVIGIFLPFIASILGIISIPILYIKLHFNLSKKFSGIVSINHRTLLFPILAFSILLLCFRIYISEIINLNAGCMKEISDEKRYFNYMIFSFWSSILLWEICFNVLKNKFLGNNLNTIKD
ncbi:hypothetical protein [Aureivirga sp. CE67]|uniref:hypothetical protein n=1 Tax=Aureivirga sp. CE67 TaxID=1788983 RepID=UPI0018C99BFA|nr:hypothetical protein [Aureivirga sp. CE67]